MSEFEEDFASMFEASVKATRHERGQTVEGTIVAIGPDVALVNIGGKGEAELDLAHIKNADGVLEFAVGDRIQATVVSTSGGVKLSRKLIRGAATARQLEDAYQSGLPVEGKIEKVVKGGYEVRIAGERAFCPLSQIDTVRTADPETHVGRVYAFRIIEFKNGGKDVVLSRRALLEDEQREQADAIRQSVVPGAILSGRVVSVRDFGAFIDLGGGVQGLLHISEMGWSRITDAAQVVAAGETITVKVLRVDEATGKIALGLKQLTDNPWSTAGTDYAVGQIHQGRVTRVSEFGAFVELAPGIEALAHASTFPPSGRRDDWKRLVPTGLTAAFEILSIDTEQRRMGVALVEEGSSRAGAAAASTTEIVPGARLTGKVERHEPYGVFVFLAPGRTGLMPLSESGVPREGDVAKAFPVGSDIEVIVLEVDPATRRIRLSHKAVQAHEDAAEMRDYAARADAAPAEGFGSLGDKLRGALGPRNK